LSDIYNPRPGEGRDPFIDSTILKNGHRLSPVKECRAIGGLKMPAYVYLLASKPHGTLYVDSTIDLARRIYEHKERAIPGFTAKYRVDKLVWFEEQDSIMDARHRERQIKERKRDWKVALIESENPQWVDLFKNFMP
jgi:putative endonuclease